MPAAGLTTASLSGSRRRKGGKQARRGAAYDSGADSSGGDSASEREEPACSATGLSEWREDEGRSVWVVDETRGNPKHRTLKQYTLEEVRKHNQPDDLWIVVAGNVYDVTKWSRYHPGGHLPLENMAGHDATDAFENYHPAYVYTKKLPAFIIGRIAGADGDSSTTDSEADTATHGAGAGAGTSTHSESALIRDFRALRQRLLKEGKFQTRPGFYIWLSLWLISLFSTAIYLTLFRQGFWWHMAGAAVLGCFWQQLAFLGHDLGHNSVSHVRRWDNLAGVTAGNVLGGISIGWWKWSHNVHHIVTNSVEHDPDIQHLPLFAVTNKIFNKFFSTFHTKWMVLDSAAQIMVAYQHYLYYPIMMLARFNLYAQSYILLASKEQWQYKTLEGFALASFWLWFTPLLSTLGSWPELFAYLLLSHAITGMLHVQITLSHFSMDTYNGRPAYELDDECWVRKQLATSMDVECPTWMDWFHGGLQFQIEHHLFPRLPRHNLRYAKALVKELCRKHNVRYHSPGFYQANVEIVQALKKAAYEVRSLPAAGRASAFWGSMLWEGMNAQG